MIALVTIDKHIFYIECGFFFLAQFFRKYLSVDIKTTLKKLCNFVQSFERYVILLVTIESILFI